MTEALCRGRAPILLRCVRCLRWCPLEYPIAGISWWDATLADRRDAACGPQLIGEDSQGFLWELDGRKPVDSGRVSGEGLEGARRSLQAHRVGLPAVAEEAAKALHRFLLRLQHHSQPFIVAEDLEATIHHSSLNE